MKSALEELVAACEEVFGPDDVPDGDPDFRWPDDEDVSHPPSGITFGMIRAARAELTLKYGIKPRSRRILSGYCDDATDSGHSSATGLGR